MVSVHKAPTPGFDRPTPRAFWRRLVPHCLQHRKGLRQTVRQGKACAIGAIDCRNKATEPCLAHVFSGVDLGQRLADHLRQKGHCPWVHALSHRCRRHRAGLLQWCHVCCQLGEGRVGLTPPPEGDPSQKDMARNFRGTWDKAGLPCGGFQGCCGEAFCSPRTGAARLFSHRRLLCTVFGCEPHFI